MPACLLEKAITICVGETGSRRIVHQHPIVVGRLSAESLQPASHRLTAFTTTLDDGDQNGSELKRWVPPSVQAVPPGPILQPGGKGTREPTDSFYAFDRS